MQSSWFARSVVALVCLCWKVSTSPSDDHAVLYSRVVIERARLALLPWGPRQELSDFAQRHPAGFDVIVGADVVYVAEFVAALMATIEALLSHSPQVWSRQMGPVPGCLHPQSSSGHVVDDVAFMMGSGPSCRCSNDLSSPLLKLCLKLRIKLPLAGACSFAFALAQFCRARHLQVRHLGVLSC